LQLEMFFFCGALRFRWQTTARNLTMPRPLTTYRTEVLSFSAWACLFPFSAHKPGHSLILFFTNKPSRDSSTVALFCLVPSSAFSSQVFSLRPTVLTRFSCPSLIPNVVKGMGILVFVVRGLNFCRTPSDPSFSFSGQTSSSDLERMKGGFFPLRRQRAVRIPPNQSFCKSGRVTSRVKKAGRSPEGEFFQIVNATL